MEPRPCPPPWPCRPRLSPQEVQVPPWLAPAEGPVLSCPDCTPPPAGPAGTEAAQSPVATWPSAAGGAGEDGHCSCSLRATRSRPPFQVGPLSWPHWPRAARSGVGGWVYRGPSAPSAQQPGRWVSCRNSAGPPPRDSAMSPQGLLRDGRLTPLPKQGTCGRWDLMESPQDKPQGIGRGWGRALGSLL